MTEILFGGRAGDRADTGHDLADQLQLPAPLDDRMLDAQFEYCAACSQWC